jgi:thiamine-monophosphate kinase
MGELELIKRFRAHAPGHPWLVAGPGHDCAILNWAAERDLAFKTDQVQEGTHFVLQGAEAASGYQIGWKAMAKTCSDIAAAGFWPVAATAALNLRRGCDEAIALEVYEGLRACCERYAFALAGGDVSVSENGLSVVVSMVGEGPHGGAWLRRGAQPGDALIVTGRLGGSRRTRKHLDFTPRLEEARLIRDMCGPAVHACIDITDGLSRDLHHLCEESGCGAVVFGDSLPCTSIPGRGAATVAEVLSEGEDFELLLAVERGATKGLLRDWRHATPLTKIGEVCPIGDGCRMVKTDGTACALDNIGYEHRA